MKFKRVFLIVLDSLGIGAAKDAATFDDAGSDTFGHIAEKMETFNIPHLVDLGMANLKKLDRVKPAADPKGYYLKLEEASNGKDTMTGHWEMMGLFTPKPFQVFTDTGFPQELIDELEKRTGHECVGNIASSGTKIIEEMGEEACKKQQLIVYTSADSVLQIAASEDTMGVEELYRCCEIARELTMREEWLVGRVIARPFTGLHPGEFERTSNRHDYAVAPPQDTLLDVLAQHGLATISIGKIADIFCHRSISEENHSDSSVHGMEQTIEHASQDFTGLCFVNLVDFDAKWGHRRNPVGYGEEIERFDEKLGKLLPLLCDDDLVMLTADHGNDPTYKGTDHTREDVPLVIYSPSFDEGCTADGRAHTLDGKGLLVTQSSFGAIGATIAENFGVQMPQHCIGESILHLLK